MVEIPKGPNLRHKNDKVAFSLQGRIQKLQKGGLEAAILARNGMEGGGGGVRGKKASINIIYSDINVFCVFSYRAY